MELVYATVVFLCSFTTSTSEHFKVVGPSVPLIAVVGEDLILPCSLQPNISAVDMTVEWFRVDQADSTVHLYKDHEDTCKQQAVIYRGRTALFKEELQKGNTSLKLSDVQVSDNGIYKCVVRSQFWYDDVTLDIIARVTGRDPVITVEKHYVSGGISLVCESKGWNPEPEVEWLDSEGVTLNAEATQTHRDSKGFNVKRRVTVYNSDSNRFYCRVKQRHYMKETEFIITNKHFIRSSINVIINFLLSSLILIGIIGLIIHVCYRRKVPKGFPHDKKDLSRIISRIFRKGFLEIEKKRENAADVSMDVDTAHPYLNLFDNGKEVKYGKKREDFCDGPKNFDDCVFVLGKEGFTESFYFEVQVKGKTDWTLGVAKENIRKKGEIVVKPKFGFWTLSKGNEIYSPSASLKHKIQKVGVSVDYDESEVSFYDVDAKSQIYSYTNQHFSEKLYPILSPGFKYGGRNDDSLIITPVSNSGEKQTTKAHTAHSEDQ